ncbi:hypothetical protein ACERK3_18625 [Phycisphaerales bacterium AB-hyl4]|uniref:Glycoside hydrolase family 42 N-terminal domain-containing protein n=1 Tax=Natronomicrosphaera hydrolytica TaxID=3242702 RepID=A0ABV4UCH7_9BACT
MPNQPSTKSLNGLYALRRTLPTWCFADRLEELVRFCREAPVDEAVLKIDSEEFSQGLPTMAWVERYLPYLEQAKQRLESEGVAFSLNPWVTQGHLDRGRDLRTVFPEYCWMVGHDGVQCRAQACPRCPHFQRDIVAIWEQYASLNPNVIWIEDDIRTFNHLPARFACFCDGHLRALADRMDLDKITRNELVSHVLAPGKPHPWRTAWLDLQRDSMRELCSLLEQAVHRVSPRTRLGLMSSGPINHCLDGRDWRALSKTLAGDRGPIYSRPTLGNYTEKESQGLYESAAQILRTRHVMPAGTIEQTEVENVPFTGYAKSRVFTFMQIAISIASGCDGVTMNLFDHMGSSMSIDPHVVRMLNEKRSFLEKLREAVGPCSVHSSTRMGVTVLHHERASDDRTVSTDDDYAALIPRDDWFEAALNRLGFPTTFVDSPLVAADGQMIGAFSDAQITSMLSRGLLLDAVAARTLQERGFGDLLGVELQPLETLNHSRVTAAEALVDPAFGGEADRYLTLTLPDLLGNGRYAPMQPSDHARPVSWIVNHKRERITPMITTYINRLGGRVAVLALEMASSFGAAFLHPYRQQQIQAILHWLSDGHVPVAIRGGTYPLVLCTRLADRIVLTLFNLSHDAWPSVEGELELGDAEVGSPYLLDHVNRADKPTIHCKRQGTRLMFTIDTTLEFGQPIACVIPIKSKVTLHPPATARPGSGGSSLCCSR